MLVPQNYLIMFGGQMNYQITDELWKYDITSSQWHQLNPQHPLGEMYPAYARLHSFFNYTCYSECHFTCFTTLKYFVFIQKCVKSKNYLILVAFS